jgi:DNA-directed RNA polymerase sigma subunit (sigma70/sigma32)
MKCDWQDTERSHEPGKRDKETEAGPDKFCGHCNSMRASDAQEETRGDPIRVLASLTPREERALRMRFGIGTGRGPQR